MYKAVSYDDDDDDQRNGDSCCGPRGKYSAPNGVNLKDERKYRDSCSIRTEI